MAIGPVGPRGEKAGQAGPRGETPGSGGGAKGPGPRGEAVGQAGPKGENPGSGSTSSSSNSRIQGADEVGDSAELKEAKKQLKRDTESGDLQAVQNDQAQIKKLQQQFAGMAG